MKLESLYRMGLGELYLLHCQGEHCHIGQLVYDKGQLVFRSSKGPLEIGLEALDLEQGFLGAITEPASGAWQSMSFYGPGRCRRDGISLDERHRALLTETKNEYGDCAFDFVGTFYRGFQLLLDAGLLPVVVFREIQIVDGLTGLAVVDLRSRIKQREVCERITNSIREAVKRCTTFTVEEVFLDQTEFDALFGRFKPTN